jgi:hypothetical protein
MDRYVALVMAPRLTMQCYALRYLEVGQCREIQCKGPSKYTVHVAVGKGWMQAGTSAYAVTTGHASWQRLGGADYDAPHGHS